jgi:3-isopropylmalate dehydrogenase
MAAICAGGMLLEELGLTEAAQSVEKAVHAALSSGKIKSLAAGKMGLSTTEIGDYIASLV